MVVPRDQSSKSLESFDQQKVWLKPMGFLGDPATPDPLLGRIAAWLWVVKRAVMGKISQSFGKATRNSSVFLDYNITSIMWEEQE